MCNLGLKVYIFMQGLPSSWCHPYRAMTLGISIYSEGWMLMSSISPQGLKSIITIRFKKSLRRVWSLWPPGFVWWPTQSSKPARWRYNDHDHDHWSSGINYPKYSNFFVSQQQIMWRGTICHKNNIFLTKEWLLVSGCERIDCIWQITGIQMIKYHSGD